MATGKNKLLRFCRLYLGGYDLSGDSRTFGSLINEEDEADITGWSDTVENVLSQARRKYGVLGYQAMINDSAGGSHPRLYAPPATHVLTLAMGGGAAPAAGDMAYILPSVQLSAPISFAGGVGMVTSDFRYSAQSYSGNFRNPFGVVLMPLTALTATTSGTGVDLGTSAAGWAATLHITVSSGGAWSYIIQYSATGAFAGEETTAGTFSADGSAVTAEFLTDTDDLDGYVRLRAVRTSGTCTIFSALARNYKA